MLRFNLLSTFMYSSFPHGQTVHKQAWFISAE